MISRKARVHSVLQLSVIVPSIVDSVIRSRCVLRSCVQVVVQCLKVQNREVPATAPSSAAYSQEDTAFVRRLHRWLGAYRLPSRLAKGPEGRRLKPLFRDSDELSAASDLTAAVRAALADADFLIVICSQRSAQSKWVGKVDLYVRLRTVRAYAPR